RPPNRDRSAQPHAGQHGKRPRPPRRRRLTPFGGPRTDRAPPRSGGRRWPARLSVLYASDAGWLLPIPKIHAHLRPPYERIRNLSRPARPNDVLHIRLNKIRAVQESED